MSSTPRSGRTKKKSALSRLAQKSSNSPDDNEEETISYSRRSTSRDDLADGYHRRRLNHDSQYPIDADVNVSRNNRYRGSDSDEGIELNTGSSGFNSTGRRQPTAPVRHYSSGKQNHAQSTSEDEDEVYPNVGHSRSVGEKHFLHQHSDGDELKLRNHKEQLWKSSSEPMKVASPRGRPHSRLGYDDDRSNGGNYGQSSESDEDDEYERSSSPIRSPDLSKRLSMKVSREEMTSLYQDVLERAEQRDEDDESEDYEKHDDLAELRTLSHSPPRHSARSPEHHTFNRQLTNSSMASSITSRTFQNAVNKHDLCGDLSQGSIQSTSAMSAITTKEARNRNFLVGSMTGSGSFLGSEELEKYFPDRKMRIFVGTWNMCELKEVPPSLDEFILPDTSEYVHDMYVIGTQESCPNKREWEIKLQETLGPQHLLFHSAAHGTLYLCIFIRRDLIWYTSVPEEAFVTTRPGPSGVKTKGACAVALSVFGTSLLFIDTHLSPHDGRVNDRIADFNKICSTLSLPKSHVQNKQEVSDATARYDCVFWLGDLNFRIEKDREHISQKVKAIESQELPDFEQLMVHDELFRIRNEGVAFVDFQEGRIKFKPTYKYDIGTDNFDTSKKMRIPSYTDRVLFRCRKKNSIVCLHYDSVSDVNISDHRPVYGFYEVNLRPGRDNVPLSVGTFNREVWRAGCQRRALVDKIKRSQKNSKMCSIQ